MESNEERYKKFIEKYAHEEDSNKTLEKVIIDYCDYVMGDFEDFELWEMEQSFKNFDILCRNLAIKHLEEKGFNIDNCLAMFNGNYYNSLFAYNGDKNGSKTLYIGK